MAPTLRAEINKMSASAVRAAKPRRTHDLLNSWPYVARRLRAASHVTLFLDFDGTLAPFHSQPEKVEPDEATRSTMRRLARRPGINVYVISGRRREDVRKRVGVAGVTYLGLHGWDTREKSRSAAGALKRSREAKKVFAERLDGLPGICIEEKGPAFVIHYRAARPQTIRRAQLIVNRLMKTLGPGLWLLEGKKVWEILPSEVRGKGAAVRELLAREPAGTLPIYIGDDQTDELAFAALPRGLTVLVGGRRPTRARFAVRDPREVKSFLERLEVELG